MFFAFFFLNNSTMLSTSNSSSSGERLAQKFGIEARAKINSSGGRWVNKFFLAAISNAFVRLGVSLKGNGRKNKTDYLLKNKVMNYDIDE